MLSDRYCNDYNERTVLIEFRSPSLVWTLTHWSSENCVRIESIDLQSS